MLCYMLVNSGLEDFMKAIKHGTAAAATAAATCGLVVAITAELVFSGLNKSEDITPTANVESFEKVDSKETKNVLSLERMNNVLVGAGMMEDFARIGETESQQETTTREETTEAETETETEAETETETQTEEETTENYAYADFFLVNVTEYLNVRAEGSEDAEILGKIYAGGGGQVLEKGEEWSKIQSGNAVGYIKNEYAWFSHDAEANIPNVCPLRATSTVDNLRLREGPGTDYKINDVINEGDQLTVMAEHGDWWAVSYDGVTGYTAKEYVNIWYDIGQGITIEEEEREREAERARIAEEAAAEQRRLQEEEEKRQKNLANAQEAQTVYSSGYNLSIDDNYLLSCLVMAEAGGECYEGKLAVANIVLNRLNSGKYGNTISDVIYASGQFSVVRNGALNRAINNGPNSGSVQAAQEALAGVNNVPNYTSFCTLAVAKYSRYAAYSIIGNQVFYR